MQSCWTATELRVLHRRHDGLTADAVPVRTTPGRTDDGEPWATFEAHGEVFASVSRECGW
jgi:hypothetical protein